MIKVRDGLTTSVVIDTDCTGNWKPTKAPINKYTLLKPMKLETNMSYFVYLQYFIFLKF
jgi:hypothetical protein